MHKYFKGGGGFGWAVHRVGRKGSCFLKTPGEAALKRAVLLCRVAPWYGTHVSQSLNYSVKWEES